MFIINIMGGLGNQLFQYNFAMFLKDKFPSAQIRLNRRYFKGDSIHGGWQLGHVIFPVEARKHNGWKVIRDSSLCLEEISDRDDIVFDGYWQDLSFFDRPYFSFADLYELPKDANTVSWEEKIRKSDCPVSVHVRCGDYNNHFLLGNIATASYFNNAISEVLHKHRTAAFFVFSDDIEWARRNLDFHDAPVYFVTGNEAPERNKYDMYLMSLCGCNILSNSSFSWWSHRFNQNEDKEALTPPYWVNETAESFPAVYSSLQSLESMSCVPNVPVDAKPCGSPLFSIILTAYNQENCIRRAVASVLNQTLKNFELIIVDDCSTDSTFEVLKGYEAINKNVHIIRHDRNSSSYTARRTGVAAASGRYVLFLDGDDYLFPDALEKLHAQVIGKEPFEVCEFSFVRRPSGVYEEPHAYDESVSRVEYFLREDCHVTVWNKLYEAEFLRRIFAELPVAYVNLGDDTLQSVCIAFRTERFIQRDILITNYREGNGVSLRKCSLTDAERNGKSIQTALGALGDFYKKNSSADMCGKIVSAAEKRLFSWMLCRIGEIPVVEEKCRAYCMLPLYFDQEEVCDEFSRVYDGFVKYTEGKFSLKNKIRTMCKKLRHIAKHIPFAKLIYDALRKTWGGVALRLPPAEPCLGSAWGDAA